MLRPPAEMLFAEEIEQLIDKSGAVGVLTAGLLGFGTLLHAFSLGLLHGIEADGGAIINAQLVIQSAHLGELVRRQSARLGQQVIRNDELSDVVHQCGEPHGFADARI